MKLRYVFYVKFSHHAQPVTLPIAGAKGVDPSNDANRYANSYDEDLSINKFSLRLSNCETYPHYQNL